MIVHEEGQVNSRTAFQLTAQSLLLTAAVLVLNNTRLEFRFVELIFGTMCCFGLVLAVVFRQSIGAAYDQMRLLKNEAAQGGGSPYARVFPIESDDLRDRLRAQGGTQARGSGATRSLPYIFVLLWLCVGTLGIVGLERARGQVMAAPTGGTAGVPGGTP
jgi:hypothetical protein